MRQRLRQLRRSSRTRLALTYLAIIMVMSLSFSVVFYNASAHELGRQVPPNMAQIRSGQYRPDDSATPIGTDQADQDVIHDFLQQRALEGRHELFLRLVIINVLTLLAGSALSYYLARRALEPLEQSMESQAQFVSDASHELRTPLTAIQTSNDVALRNPKLTLKAAKQVIAGNSQEASKLQQLSASLLDLAAQDARDISLTTVNLQEAASVAINRVIPMAQAKNIVIEDNLPPLNVLATPEGLSQLLVILLDNSVKYGRPAGHTSLSASQKGHHIYVQVRDDGIGIRASDVPHVFRRFYRADSARRDGHSQGYGLGLAIAQTITQQYDGTISVRSEVGKGSTFTIRLKPGR